MKLNRVVVTGYGLTSPIGNTPEEFWNSLKNGKIGIGEITKLITVLLTSIMQQRLMIFLLTNIL